MARIFKFDFFNQVLPVMTVLIIGVLTWVFATQSGWVYWLALLGYPLLCCLPPLAIYFRTRNSNYGGAEGGALVSSVLFATLLGAELIAWVSARLFF